MRLLGPVQMLQGARIRSMADFERAVRAIARALQVRYDAGVYIARVEHGRWIADCPCGAGIAVHPQWTEAGCLECGRWWPVMVPRDWDDIEAVLLARPKAVNRGWLPGETATVLREENITRGLPEVIATSRPQRQIIADDAVDAVVVSQEGGL